MVVIVGFYVVLYCFVLSLQGSSQSTEWPGSLPKGVRLTHRFCDSGAHDLDIRVSVTVNFSETVKFIQLHCGHLNKDKLIVEGDKDIDKKV